MRLYRPTYTDKRTGKKKQSRVYWLQIGHHGKDLRMSTGQAGKRAAERWTKQKIAELQAGIGIEHPGRLTFKDLAEMLRDDYRAKRNRSTERLDFALDRHLEPYFGDFRAVDITPEAVRRYQRQRGDEGAANSTINREVSFLRRALRLAHQYGRLPRVPHIPMLTEPAARDVTLENAGELTALLNELPDCHRGWVALAACTGWRREAVLSRKWAHISTDSDGLKWLHLDRRSSKNKEPYRFPVVGDVDRILKEQRAYVERVQKRTGKVIPWIFCFKDGKRIWTPEYWFKRAAKAIGRPELHIHDLRRFAASRMAELGIPESDAMELLGMETRSIFTRYDISSGARKVRAVEQLAGALDAKPQKKVVNMDRR